MLSDLEVIDSYNACLTSLNALSEEVRFAISDVLTDQSISFGSLEVRVKDIGSILKKVRDKEYTEFNQITDLVGARVICPFRSDLDKVKKAITNSFHVQEFDDKAIDDPDKFGYMSLHFLCRIKSDHIGPRYDKIRDRTFEIQVRTICMHAWSSIQHSLQYKGDWDVPAELRKDINALSALFYLADTQFEAVFNAKNNAGAHALEASKDTNSSEFGEQDVNLETLAAYGATKFPTRKAVPISEFSNLVFQINKAGYKTIGEIDKDINRAIPALDAEESDRGSNYNTVGAIRVSLSFASRSFEEVTYGKSHVHKQHHRRLMKADK